MVKTDDYGVFNNRNLALLFKTPTTGITDVLPLSVASDTNKLVTALKTGIEKAIGCDFSNRLFLITNIIIEYGWESLISDVYMSYIYPNLGKPSLVINFLNDVNEQLDLYMKDCDLWQKKYYGQYGSLLETVYLRIIEFEALGILFDTPKVLMDIISENNLSYDTKLIEYIRNSYVEIEADRIPEFVRDDNI